MVFDFIEEIAFTMLPGGRVAKLILALREEAPFGDVTQKLEPEDRRGLLNAAAVLSTRHGAEVFVLPAGTMARSSPVAAIFRY